MEDLKKVEGTAFNVAEEKKKKGGCGKYVFLTLLLALLIGGAIFWWKYYYTFSDGSRIGMLQKISHKGNIMKTYEGELVLSSISSTAGVGIASEKFFFSIEDQKVADQMLTLEGKKVKLHYQQKNGSLFWRGDSDYIVDGVSVEP